MANKSGELFVFEGIDGSGKSLVSHSVMAELRDRGYDVIVTSEPEGWNKLGVAVHDILKTIPMSPLAQFYLFSAARVVHMERIEQWLSGGSIVLSDRYMHSSFVFQGILGGVPVERMLQTMKDIGVRIPRMTFILDVDVETAMRRQWDRGLSLLERGKDEMYWETAARAYREFIPTIFEGVVVVNANRPVEEVTSECLKYILSMI